MIFDRFGKCGWRKIMLQIRLRMRQCCEKPATRCKRVLRCATCRWYPTNRARARLKGENAELQRAWYRGQVAKYFSFNEATLSAAGTNVPVSPIYVTFNVNPREPDGGPASGFRTELKSLQTHNVPSTLPGDAGYSPLWLVAVYDNANWPSVRDLDTVLKAKVLAAGAATVNCPIVFIGP